jgi:hypothetical protein
MKEGIRRCLMVDLDGTMFYGPWPKKTSWELLRGELTIPLVGEDLGVYRGEGLGSKLSVTAHQYRLPIRSSWEALERLLEEDGSLGAVVVSGREQDKHRMTMEVLEQMGKRQLFDGFYLNPGRRATTWKGVAVNRVRSDLGVEEVFLIDDDLRAGLVAAREIGDKGEVYVLRLPIYCPPILRRAGVELPANLRLVGKVAEAMEIIGRKRVGSY